MKHRRHMFTFNDDNEQGKGCPAKRPKKEHTEPNKAPGNGYYQAKIQLLQQLETHVSKRTTLEKQQETPQPDKPVQK